MLVAQRDLELEHLWVVHPGERSMAMGEGISALALRDLDDLARERRFA